MLCNDRVFGVACSGGLDRTTLLSILKRLPTGVTEIYLHPAVATASPLSESMSTYRHSDELAALLDPEVLQARTASKALYGGYTDLKVTMATSPW
jgi:hypothetical protein